MRQLFSTIVRGFLDTGPRQGEHLTMYSDITRSEWSNIRWPDFTWHEFHCRHCGGCRMNPLVIDNIQTIRNYLGIPLRVTSGYRCSQHSLERGKHKPGAHPMGEAVDIGCIGGDAYRILDGAMSALKPERRPTGIGVSMKGDSRFLHLDWVKAGDSHLYRPCMWSY